MSIYYDIKGQKEDGDWYPLYNYTDRGIARGILNHIFSIPDERLPRELEGFVDFKVFPPDEERKPERTKKTSRYVPYSPPTAEVKTEKRKKSKGLKSKQKIRSKSRRSAS